MTDVDVAAFNEVGTRALDAFLKAQGYNVVDPCGGGCEHAPDKVQSEIVADGFNDAFDIAMKLRTHTLYDFEHHFISLQIRTLNEGPMKSVRHVVLVELPGGYSQLKRRKLF